MENALQKSGITTTTLQRINFNPSKHEKQLMYRILKDDLACSICIEIFKKPHELGCGHMFCGSCISKWLREHRACPICRVPVTFLQRPVECKFIDKFIKEMMSVLNSENRRNTLESSFMRKSTIKKNDNGERPPWRF